MVRWVYENGEVREERPGEFPENSSPANIAKVRRGDHVWLSMEFEKFKKFLAIDHDALFNELALPVGRAFMEWSRSCDLVLDIFVACAGVTEDIGICIFDKMRSDKTQRDLTLGVAEVKFSSKHPIVETLRMVLRDLDRLGKHRNLFAHHVFDIVLDENFNAKVEPSPKRPSHEPYENSVDIARSLLEKLKACNERLLGLLYNIENVE